jgi:hypothetical protein
MPAETLPTTENPKKPKTTAQRAASIALNAFAAAFWVYVVAKLFIFDIDIWALQLVAPSLVWLLAYKFPVLMVATILIFASSAHFILYGSILLLLGIVTTAYAWAFVKAFQPSAVFRFYAKTFPAIKKTERFKFDGDFINLPVEALTSEQQLARTKGIQTVVLYNRACFFVAKRLRDYQRSRLNVVAYAISLVGLLIVTVFSFALINFAAFKIDAALFQFNYSPHAFFSFLYYSAGSMFYATNGISPIATLSQGVQLVQFLFAVFLLVIFLTVVLTMRNERNTEELNDAIKTLEEEGRSVEGTLRGTFNINNIATAIKALETAKSDLLGLILWATRDVDDNDSAT